MGDAQRNEHQLWVNLSALGDGNIFAILPQLMQKMLESEQGNDLLNGSGEEVFDLVLPSDDAWQAKIYYKLVEKQRMADAMEDENMQSWLHQGNQEEKLHDWLIKPKTKKIILCDNRQNEQVKKTRTTGPGPITWRVSDIAKAGCLLTAPALPTNFEDEQEMRRVYTLIYDVFRYKNVLTVALNDIAFFTHYPELKANISHVWLLFYDLYHRNFRKRETNLFFMAQELFKDVGLIPAENALWQLRTKLAASVSRLRIEHSALSLNELLPNHLRDERVKGQQDTNNIVTCWVNAKKIKTMEELKRQIESVFKLQPVEDMNSMGPNCYKCDKHCPHVVTFHGSMRTDLAKSELVKNHKLIVQDKSFCLGPATFFKQLTDLELTGSVIQTHINSPRTTAYLANVLSQNEKIKKLMAFSAGKRKGEYETYFNQLGMTNIVLFADRLIDINPDAQYMEEVVAVFATPPNSYSAVNDPIDLVCSRGGDLSMLEILTESEDSDEGRKRVFDILDEQKRTLRFAMSRPQIQFVLYETHSGLDAENEGMVTKTIKEVNKMAKLHHASLQGKITLPTIAQESSTGVIVAEINNNDEKCQINEKEIETEASISTIMPEKNSLLSAESDEIKFQSVLVPDTDIFDIPLLPNLCPSDTYCMDLVKEGCYLALLQRKQVIRLDNKYMIQMAENRGLFGRTSSSSTRTKGSKASKKKIVKPPTPPPKTKRRIKDTEIARIAAPTHTFLLHTAHEGGHVKECLRCKMEHEKSGTPICKQWWMQTTQHITALRSSLIKNKVIPAAKKSSKDTSVKNVVDLLISNNAKVDEVLAKSRGVNNSNIPVFPKLKLVRENKIQKTQVNLAVTEVLLPLQDSTNNVSNY